jgi:hypothetical protein
MKMLKINISCGVHKAAMRQFVWRFGLVVGGSVEVIF